MARTLLPVFDKFKIEFISVPEPLEDFSFLREGHERQMFERFREIVNKTEGAREYLAAYKKEEGKWPFYDGLGPNLIDQCITVEGQDYKLDFIIGIDAAQQYHIALFRLGWDAFVIKKKTEQAKDLYKATQIPKEDLWPYLHASTHKKALWHCYSNDPTWVEKADGDIKAAVQGVKAKYKLEKTDDEVAIMLEERCEEFDREIKEESAFLISRSHR
jgi:hypothetical protein